MKLNQLFLSKIRPALKNGFFIPFNSCHLTAACSNQNGLLRLSNFLLCFGLLGSLSDEAEIAESRRSRPAIRSVSATAAFKAFTWSEAQQHPRGLEIVHAFRQNGYGTELSCEINGALQLA